jgi:hypothetical protein
VLKGKNTLPFGRSERVNDFYPSTSEKGKKLSGNRSTSFTLSARKRVKSFYPQKKEERERERKNSTCDLSQRSTTAKTSTW